VSRWQIVPLENGYTLTNPTPYTKYVQGDAYGVVHSGIHRDRWDPLRDIVEQETDKLPEEIEKNIVMVARRNGF
jgi:hypothetical protein